MTRRMRAPSILKTGKKNSKEVAKYVRYDNQTTQYVCVSPLEGNFSYYEKGVDFPACENFKNEWNQTEVR